MKKIFESKFRIIYIIITAMAMYTILLTGSRGGVLAVLVTIAAFAVIYPKGATKKFIAIVIMLGAVVIFWLFIRPLLPEAIVERMSVDAVIETKGTYRMDIWTSIFNEIKNSSWEVIFGRGFDVKHAVFLNGREYHEVAHNHILQILYDQGFIGLILFGALVTACIVRCINKRKCVSIAMIGMMALSVSLTFGTSTKSFWNLIPYAAFAFCESKKEDEDEDDIYSIVEEENSV